MDFAIIGAQKSASTSLQQALSRRPDTYMPIGETAVFESAFYSREAVERESARWQLEAMPTQKIGIKRPDYLCLPEAPANIARHFPHARFVVVLRNPADRALSAYYHYARSGLIEPRDHEEGLRILLDQWSEGSDHTARRFEIISYGLYGAALARWLKHFNPDQIHVIEQTALLNDSTRALAAVADHLGILEAPPLELGRRRMEGSFSLRRLKVQSRLRPLFYREVANERRVARTQVGAWLYEGFDRALLARIYPADRPVLSEELRKRLTTFYAQDSAQLAELGIDFLNRWQPGTA